MKPQYVAKINNIHDVKSRIIYDWMSAKEDEREHRKEMFLYRDKGYSFYKQDTTKNHYKHLEEIASEKMWMSIGRQLNARSLWDSIVRSEKIWPKEPQSKEDFDFSAIQEEDIPFNNEGE